MFTLSQAIINPPQSPQREQNELPGSPNRLVSPEPTTFELADMNASNTSSIQTSTKKEGASAPPAEIVTPSFLFGQHQRERHRSFGPNSPLYAPARRFTDCKVEDCLSPIPSRLNTGPKSVTWSPILTRSSSNNRVSESSESGQTPSDMSYTMSTSTSTFKPDCSGPPLRSLDDALNASTHIHRQDDFMDTLSYLDDDEMTHYHDAQESTGDEIPETEHHFWVKVYGFNPLDADEVIRFFGRHGNVVSYKIPDDGNWVMIRYSSEIHVTQALMRDAKHFRRNVMIGVTTVTNQEIVENELANDSVILSETIAARTGTRFVTPYRFGDESPRDNDEAAEELEPFQPMSNNNDNNKKVSMRSLSASVRPGGRAADASLNSSSAFIHKEEEESFVEKVWGYIRPF
ncbi:hypothetical protein L596_005749 [Steinernema carpocapsae]|uniref:Nucleoporin NUP35 n=1 Tax=Steinernema carpocapsae TaxID=34508 RepID=A0A4U8V047_STECR|nr:hypothetical protein L596_005749 [Steinernema carpocapsae]